MALGGKNGPGKDMLTPSTNDRAATSTTAIALRSWEGNSLPGVVGIKGAPSVSLFFDSIYSYLSDIFFFAESISLLIANVNS